MGFHIFARNKYIPRGFSGFRPRPLSFFSTYFAPTRVCYLREERWRQDTGSGILMYALLCILLGHDCVSTVAHAVVLPLEGISLGIQ